MKLFPTLAAVVVLAACKGGDFEQPDERVTSADLNFATEMCSNHGGLASFKVRKWKGSNWYAVACTDGITASVERPNTPKPN
jgi:hypothetical protein